MTAPTPEQMRALADQVDGYSWGDDPEVATALRAAADQLEAVQTEHYSVADRASMADQSWIADGDRVTYGEVSSTGELVIVMIERRVSLIEDEAKTTDPVDTDALRKLSAQLYGMSMLAKSQLTKAAADEVDRLRTVIENAPHREKCRPEITCTCWKADAL